jgi:glycosyltransferase involved in cell wall biosynthesis
MAGVAGKPTVVFIHGWDPRCERALKGSAGVLFSRLYGHADAIIVLASTFRDAIREFGYNGPIYTETTIVPEGSYPRHARSDTDRERFRLLYLARTETRKGLYITIDAYAIAKCAHPQISLTVAGIGTELERAKQYVAKAGLLGVDFPGYVTGTLKREAFLDADCYILPTFDNEGMPTSVLEAMAFGLPVLTRPVAGLRDFFSSPEMGYAFESTDPPDFARAICELVDNPSLYETISSHNHRYAAATFGAAAVAKRIDHIYQSLAPRR